MPGRQPVAVVRLDAVRDECAYPQPRASTCCCQVGPVGTRPPAGPGGGVRSDCRWCSGIGRRGRGGAAAPDRRGAPDRPGHGPVRTPPNCMITGTGPFAFAGVVSVTWMSTVTCGYAELSTCPTSSFVMIGTSPFMPCVVLITSHVTFGVTFGVRP